jgi:hypothetical protein
VHLRRGAEISRTTISTIKMIILGATAHHKSQKKTRFWPVSQLVRAVYSTLTSNKDLTGRFMGPEEGGKKILSTDPSSIQIAITLAVAQY